DSGYASLDTKSFVYDIRRGHSRCAFCNWENLREGARFEWRGAEKVATIISDLVRLLIESPYVIMQSITDISGTEWQNCARGREKSHPVDIAAVTTSCHDGAPQAAAGGVLYFNCMAINRVADTVPVLVTCAEQVSGFVREDQISREAVGYVAAT